MTVGKSPLPVSWYTSPNTVALDIPTALHRCASYRTLHIIYAMMRSHTSMEPKHQGRRTQGRFPAVMEK